MMTAVFQSFVNSDQSTVAMPSWSCHSLLTLTQFSMAMFHTVHSWTRRA